MNVSGTITTGGVAQVLAPAITSQSGFSGFWVRNNSSASLWINTNNGTASAAQPSLEIVAGALYESPPNSQPVGAISIFGATTGQSFTAQRF